MTNEPAGWNKVKTRLQQSDRQGLVGVIKDLYDASGSNRRFLHARFVSSAAALADYRKLVAEAVFPAPSKPIRLRDAAAAIAEYKRSTGDLAGVVDLLVTFVEEGTNQATELGYGDDRYFSTLERKLTEAVQILDSLDDVSRLALIARIVRIGERRDLIGYGYGDFIGDVADRAQARETSRRKHQANTADRDRPPAPRQAGPSPTPMRPSFTSKQGQYLAFIHAFSKVHRQAPAEADFQRFFRVSPPTVHTMIVTLERRGLISRTSGVARSIVLRVTPPELPELK